MCRNSENQSFSLLVYRSLVLSRKSLIISILTIMSLTAMFLLILLSAEKGNIAKYSTDANNLKNTIEVMRIAGQFTPLLMLMAVPEFFSQDYGRTVWRYFKKSTPVTPFRTAASYYMLPIIYVIIAVVMMAVFMLGDYLITGEAIGKGRIAISLLAMLISVFGAVYVSFFVQLFKGSMAATVVSFFTLMVPFFVWDIKRGLNSNGNANNLSLDSISEKATPYIPLMIIGIVLIFFIGIVLSAMLYKRREK